MSKYYVTVEARMMVTADSEVMAQGFAVASVGGSGCDDIERAVDVRGVDIVAITPEEE